MHISYLFASGVNMDCFFIVPSGRIDPAVLAEGEFCEPEFKLFSVFTYVQDLLTGILAHRKEEIYFFCIKRAKGLFVFFYSCAIFVQSQDIFNELSELTCRKRYAMVTVNNGIFNFFGCFWYRVHK